MTVERLIISVFCLLGFACGFVDVEWVVSKFKDKYILGLPYAVWPFLILWVLLCSSIFLLKIPVESAPFLKYKLF